MSYFILLEIFKQVGGYGAKQKNDLKYLFFAKSAGSFIVLITAMLITYYNQLDRPCPAGYAYPYPAYPQPCGVAIIGTNPPGMPTGTFPWAIASTTSFGIVVSLAIVCR